jgi:short-subunit dehydrogenase
VESLQDQVVVITGASAGIGRATARELLGAGASVVLGARRRQRLDQLAAEFPDRVAAVTMDVRIPADSQRLVSTALERFGRLDVLVANTGIGMYGGILDNSDESLAAMLDTNIAGTVWPIRAAVPHMIEAGRSDIVIVASVAGFRGGADEAVYAATKFAQVGLAESLRVELAGTSVRVGVVFPVSTETEFRDAMAREQGFEVEGTGPRQSAGQVARAIVRGIESGQPEIYPHPASKLLSIVSAAFPRLADRIVRRFGRKPIAKGEAR